MNLLTLALAKAYVNEKMSNISGVKGDKGDTGVSVTNVDINTSNHLIITLSDSSTIDAGLIETVSGKDGKDGKSAYTYAQDGGYTRTEAEFMYKLAREYSAPDLAVNDPTDPAYVQNRTHYVEVTSAQLTFDPDVNTEAYSFLRKISNTPMTLNEIKTAAYIIATPKGDVDGTVGDNVVSGDGYYTAFVTGAGIATQFISIYQAQTEADFGIDIPEGTYVPYIVSNSPDYYIKQINYTSEIIHAINPKYLPDKTVVYANNEEMVYLYADSEYSNKLTKDEVMKLTNKGFVISLISVDGGNALIVPLGAAVESGSNFAHVMAYAGEFIDLYSSEYTG